jgi:hypothetical protein
VLQLDASAADAGTLRAALKAAQQALAATGPAVSTPGCALRLRSDELAVQEQAGSAAAATATGAPAAAASLFTIDQLAAMLRRENELRLSPETQEAYRGALAGGRAGEQGASATLPALIARRPVAFRRRPPARRVNAATTVAACSRVLLLRLRSVRGGTARANVTDVPQLLSCGGRRPDVCCLCSVSSSFSPADTAAELREDTDWMEVTDGLQRSVLREFGMPPRLVRCACCPCWPCCACCCARAGVALLPHLACWPGPHLCMRLLLVAAGVPALVYASACRPTWRTASACLDACSCGVGSTHACPRHAAC